MSEVKMFTMIRNSDESGISGTGRVLDGVVFHNGLTVVTWRTSKHPSSTTTFQCYDDFKRIHVESHPTNDTEILWFDQVKFPVRVKTPIKATKTTPKRSSSRVTKKLKTINDLVKANPSKLTIFRSWAKDSALKPSSNAVSGDLVVKSVPSPEKPTFRYDASKRVLSCVNTSYAFADMTLEQFEGWLSKR